MDVLKATNQGVLCFDGSPAKISPRDPEHDFRKAGNMDDYTVSVLNDQHVPTFQRSGGLLTVRRVQIMVGRFGPFYQDFTPPSDKAADVRSWIIQQVSDIKAAHGA
jgi:hypothetical protein